MGTLRWWRDESQHQRWNEPFARRSSRIFTKSYLQRQRLFPECCWKTAPAMGTESIRSGRRWSSALASLQRSQSNLLVCELGELSPAYRAAVYGNSSNRRRACWRFFHDCHPGSRPLRGRIQCAGRLSAELRCPCAILRKHYSSESNQSHLKSATRPVAKS